MEVLLSNPDTRSQQTQRILSKTEHESLDISSEMRKPRKQLEAEIRVISECLRGRSSEENESFSTDSTTQSTRSREVMNPMEWVEEQVNSSQNAPTARDLCVPLPRGFFHTVRFLTAGLSTRCSYAYFLKEDLILVYSLSSQGRGIGERPISQQATPKTKYCSAALSEKFLAVLIEKSIKKSAGKSTEESLQVFRLDGRLVGTDTFGTEGNGHRWNPNSLIATHEVADRTWIAVGGCTKHDGVLSGSIKIYYVADQGGTATLTKHVVTFNRPKPNLLALDFLKALAFGPDDDGSNVIKLVCATNNNRVLIWRLADIEHSLSAPFVIKRDLNKVSLL